MLFSLFLFKGYGHSHTAMHSCSLNVVVDDIQYNNESLCSEHQAPDYILFDNLLDDNDDDDDFISIKEKTSLRNYTSIFADTFFLDNPSFLKKDSQFHKNYSYLSPDKYIFQRVLRV